MQAENKRIISQAAAQFFPTECSVEVPLSRSGILTSTHRLVSTPGIPALSLQYLGMETCGTESALTLSVLIIIGQENFIFWLKLFGESICFLYIYGHFLIEK